MPPHEPVLAVEVLREAVRQRVAESSLRAVAREIGLSFKGVDKFLAGSEPFAGTKRKLADWYLRRQASGEEQPTAETAHAALAVLLRHLPPAQREQGRKRLLEVVQQIGEEGKVGPPRWMEAMG